MCISAYKCVHLMPWMTLARAVSTLRGAERWVLVSRGGFMAPHGGCGRVQAPGCTELALHPKITSLSWRS